MDKSTSRRDQVEDWAADVELILITARPVFITKNYAHHGYVSVMDTRINGLFEFVISLDIAHATTFDDEVTALQFLKKRHLPACEFIMLRRVAA